MAIPSRILIVDDEPHNRQLLKLMLGPDGFIVEAVASGVEALRAVAARAPDLILLDLVMPGMDGYQLADTLKSNEATRSIPIIMVTDLDDRTARMRGLSAGAEDFLSKPVDRAELCVRVRNLLRLKAYADYHDRYSQVLEGEVGSRRADLIESERLYRSTFEAAPVGIVHMGLDGRWLRVNQRLCDLLGYSCEELQTESVHELLHAEESTGDAESLLRMSAGLSDGYVIEERRYRRRDGSFVWVRINISLYRDAGGAAQHLIAVIENITERRTLEAQVRQAGKMDAIGRLASGVAHDFNNLLTVIIGFAEIVTKDPVIAERHATDLAEIVRAAERAAGLTRQLLAFSRQQVLHAAPLDVNGLIQDMTGMLRRLIGEHIHVTLQLDPALSLALADRGQMEQVVMNLVVNARDAMADGGAITIATSDVTLENSAFHEEAVVDGSYVMLAINDSGAGMNAETRRRIFEPFFTTKEAGKGTGLGLSTTYGIVKQSKGYIWVYSEPGHGTTFKVYLPRTTRDLPILPPSAAHPSNGAGAAQTVLLVEDEAGVRRLATRILEKAGYVVLAATDGEDAIRVFGAHAGTIALVVTDVIMPGCGGPELLARLQKQTAGLRVLYMSGYTEQSAFHKFGVGAGLPFLQKPFTAAELVRHVRDALEPS